MSSKIKGGGRAILSKESQQSLIDLLFSLEDDHDGRRSSSFSESSGHDRKHLQKKFVKALIRRHERRVLREQFNGSCKGSKSPVEETAEKSANGVAAGVSAMTLSGSTSTSGNVRIELTEAIFTTGDDKEKSTSKKSSKKDSKKDKDKSNSKKKKKKDKGDLFKIGAKKVVVLPRSTSITNLLKQSKSKLKLKKNPVRAFVQSDSGSTSPLLFDLEHDLSGVVDGTVIYVTLTPKADNDTNGTNNDEEDNDQDHDTDDNIDTILDSIKLAYKQQQAHRNSLHQSRKQELKRKSEIIDTKRQQLLLESRQRLPVAAYKEQILDIIQENQTVVLSGATGSGKSTQIPQFLLESSDEEDSQVHNRRPYIVVTQPRRVAAISLAQRVAQERGCPPPGRTGSSIGYMVRSDRRVDFRSCRVIYMTIGVLLRIILSGGTQAGETGEDDCDDNDNGDIVQPLTLESISHLVIDETHERDVNTDFALTLLKGMMISAAKKSPGAIAKKLPRLVLMSATASSELFVNYFSLAGTKPATIDIPGRTFPVETHWLAECEKFTGKTMNRLGSDGTAVEGMEGDGIASPRAMEKIDDKFIRSLIVKIVEKQQNEGQLNRNSSNTEYRSTGAILVFLPGLGEIESLARCLYDKGTIVGNRDVCNVLKLHSTTPKVDQSRVFEPAKKATVKIILSTNIAETSLTVADVSYVIDTCRVKESRYQSSSRIKELITVWTSHAAMKQRTGRAGRTSNGTCYRLCSEEFAREKLLPQTSPEIIRTPLDELILQVCLLYEQRLDEVNARPKSESKPAFPPGANPLKFLSMTPTSPKKESLVQSCRHLLEVDALKIVNNGETDDESARLYRLTPIGYHCSKLPMDAKLAKTLIVGCILGVLDNALVIAASLSCTKSCFMSGRQLDPVAVEARDALIEDGFGGRDWPGGTVKSDMIAIIAVYRQWTLQKDKREKFCRDHALNYLALCEIDTLRQQFMAYVIDAGLASRDNLKDCNIAKDDALITSCCLVAGLYPNICTLVRPRKGGPKGGRLLTKDGNVSRPSSSSFQRKRVAAAAENGKDAYAIYHAKHRTIGAVGTGGQRQRPPETFLSEVNFVSKFSLLLFGGQLELVKNAIIIDGWLKFKVSDDSESKKGSAIDNAVLIMSLRDVLDKVIIEHVVETFASSEEKSTMMERHKQIIEVVRKILSEEG